MLNNFSETKIETDEGKAIDCGHFIPEEAPTESYDILSEWLMRTTRIN